MSLPAGIMGVLELISSTPMLPAGSDIRVEYQKLQYSLDAADDERKYSSKHVEQPRNNKLSYTVAPSWSFSYIMHMGHLTEPGQRRRYVK
jgi:hypothetical protein